MKKFLIPLMLLALCSCTPRNNSSNNVTSSESITQSSDVLSESSSENSSLDELKNNSIIALTNKFNNYDIDNYSNKNWNSLIEILTQAEYDIYNANSTDEVTNILEKGINDLDNVKTYEEEKQSEKTIIEVNQAIEIGSVYSYPLSKIATPEKIMRVKVVLDIDFNNAPEDKIYWGGEIAIGPNGSKTKSKKSISGAGYEERVDANEDNVPESTRQTINFDNIDISNLTSSSNLEICVTYGGGDYKIKIVSLSFYYNNNYELKEEKIIIGQPIYKNSTVHLAYDKLKNKGDVYKIELNLTIYGNTSYTGGTIYVTGCRFTPKNTANIGDIMLANDEAIGSVYIYPEEKVDLSLSQEFSFTSWWAPASEITLNYIIVYTY